MIDARDIAKPKNILVEIFKILFSDGSDTVKKNNQKIKIIEFKIKRSLFLIFIIIVLLSQYHYNVLFAAQCLCLKQLY